MWNAGPTDLVNRNAMPGDKEHILAAATNCICLLLWTKGIKALFHLIRERNGRRLGPPYWKNRSMMNAVNTTSILTWNGLIIFSKIDGTNVRLLTFGNMSNTEPDFVYRGGDTSI